MSKRMRGSTETIRPPIHRTAVANAVTQLAKRAGVCDAEATVEARQVLGVDEVTYILIATGLASSVLNASLYELTGVMQVGDTGVWVLQERQIRDLLRQAPA